MNVRNPLIFRKTRLAFSKTIGEKYFIQKPIKTEDLLKN